MTRWWWVRHAPTHARCIYGWKDLPADLSDGDALRRLDRFLPGGAHVVASPLSRTVETARAIVGDRPRLPDEPGLREIHFGEWEGLRTEELRADDQAVADAFWRTPGDTAPPGGESWNQVAARVAEVVDRLTSQHPDRDIVAVAHFGVILTQLQRASGMPPAATLSFSVENLSVTCLESHPGENESGGFWRIRFVNHVP